MCQEQIVSYGKLYGLLQANGIRLFMVSIGTPEKAALLVDHLGVNDNMMLYVDPTNACYDALDLRRGVDRTFTNINTPFAFLDRWRRGETGDLQTVLKDWIQKGFFIPPEQHQAFLQGGTFVFRNGKTVYAHYDPSTAAHSSMERVLELATPPREESMAK